MGKIVIDSDFALLDVRGPDGALYNRMTEESWSHRVPVVIRGEIVRVWGDHDGTSREYQVNVQTVDVKDRG